MTNTPGWAPRPASRFLTCLVAAVTTATAIGMSTAPAQAHARATDAPVASSPSTTVETAFYRLDRRVAHLPAATPWVTALRGEQVLALGADSEFVGSPLLGGTSTTYPLYTFDAAAGTANALGGLDIGPIVGPGGRTRILDFQYLPALQVDGDPRARALVSLGTYSPQTGCRRVVVAEIAVDLTGAGANALGRTWFALPCVAAFTPTEGDWLVGPGLNQSGGRVALVPQDQWRSARRPEIYLTVGDFAVLANLSASVPIPARRLLGTVLRIPVGGAPAIVARGIRNSQGLTIARLDRRSALVATTHGPRGGDGLLDIRRGDDYGWPRETYGTVYDYLPTPAQSKPKVEGRLPTATKPAFAWLPSIGPSAVHQVTGPAFGAWWGAVRGRPTGDLLVAGMAAQRLDRIRWDAGAVRYVESIDIGARIRSLTQTTTGVLVAGVDTAGPDAGSILVLRPVAAWDSATNALR